MTRPAKKAANKTKAAKLKPGSVAKELAPTMRLMGSAETKTAGKKSAASKSNVPDSAAVKTMVEALEKQPHPPRSRSVNIIDTGGTMNCAPRLPGNACQTRNCSHAGASAVVSSN
jgi:hypothetical protein